MMLLRPICRNAVRNSGGTHDAWADFDGCLSHLDTAPRCIGSLMIEDTVAREWLPMLTINLCQSQLCLSACLGSCFIREPWRCPSSKRLCRRTPSGGLGAVRDQGLRWLHQHHSSSFGTQMGCHQIGEHIPGRKDTDNIFHPRFIGNGIPRANTFHAVIYERAKKWVQNSEAWCQKEAWLHIRQHSISVSPVHPVIFGDYQFLFQRVRRSSSLKGQERSMWTLSPTHCMPHHLI